MMTLVTWIIHPTMITIKIGYIWNPWANNALKPSIAYWTIKHEMLDKSLCVYGKNSRIQIQKWQNNYDIRPYRLAIVLFHENPKKILHLYVITRHAKNLTFFWLNK